MASVQGFECVCPVDATPVYQFAESLKDQNKTFEDARGDLHKAHTAITSSMTSRATDNLIDELDRQIARIDETVTHRQTRIDATMTFHDEIVTCKARFSNIIFQALCNGLMVDDNTIIDPALSGTSQSGAASLSPSYVVAREDAYHAYSDFSAAEETYRQAWERTKPNNWSASPGRGKDALKFKGWAAQGSRYLSRAAVVGAVIDGGIAAWTQWEADSANPAMGQGEKVARATTSGTLSGGGALGGALAGAKFGAFLDSFTANPIGIAVGGAVGEIVGGLIGSGLGQWAANGISSFMSDQIHG